ncbi:MAG: hypothetical protein KAI66_17620 [Lentisphaeria bacterium]|nr:hypothetical protein [Lentisphaeria bacterium]
MMDQNVKQGETPIAPTWLVVLMSVAVLSMGTQVRLPVLAGRIALADVVAGLAFAGLLVHLFRSRDRLPFAWPVGAVLALYILSNVFSRSGLTGAFESVQRVEQFFCGYLLFAAFLKYRGEKLLPRVLGAAVALNVVFALVQGFRFGFGASLEPADVKAISWGFGEAFTGLFRDRVSLGVFLVVSLCWLLPCFFRRLDRKYLIGAGATVALVLGFVAHGQILLVGAVAVILAGFFWSWRCGIASCCGVLALVLSLCLGDSRASVVRESLSPMQSGQGVLKTCHVELVAALRMAGRAPLAGVGAGRYQQFVGGCYGELPNPNRNTIETDTQSGLGILLGTVGFPAGLAFLVLLVYGATRALERFYSSGRTDGRALGSACCLLLFLALMPLTDPLISGVGWFLALALAGAFGVGGEKGRAIGVHDVGFAHVLAWGVGFAVLVGCVAVVPQGNPLARVGTVRKPRIMPPVALAPAPTGVTPQAGDTTPPASVSGGMPLDFFRVIDAGDAKSVSAPAVKAKDSLAAKQAIIDIPDKKGVPPEGEAPAMKHGGAAYDLVTPAALSCKIWLRVWWEGSCGNTIYVRLGKEGTPVVVGNDGTYKSWHWMETPKPMALVAGSQELFLLNREDGVRVDQILITNDMEYVPQDIEEE